ncbi:MAG TPA: TetR family transcriptional regulator [Gaiellaceae bacterium]
MAATRPERRTRSDGERSRQTILRAAANLATVDGLEGLSIGNLAAHIGMSKSGLYAHFGSKEELQLATVDTAGQILAAEVIEPTEAIADPRERLEALLDRFLAYVERGVFQGGCFFASAEAEFGNRPGPVRDKIRAAQQDWRALLEHLVREAQAAGSVDAAEDPVQLAFELDAYLLMGNTGFVLHDEPAYLEQARAAIRRRL